MRAPSPRFHPIRVPERVPYLVIAAAALLFGTTGLVSAKASDMSKDYAEINQELDQLESPHPWAGSYGGPGSFSPHFIVIAPSGRYCSATFYDMGPTIQGNCGRLRLDGDRFVTAGRPQQWELEDSDGPPYLRIPWGARSYVVPERRMIEFINGVNGAREPRYDRGAFGGGAMGSYLRGGDRSILVAGQPEIPEKYRNLLREKALDTTAVFISTRTNVVTRVGNIEIEDCGAPARFDAGSASGAFVGMKLHAQSGDVHASAILDAVEATSSTGRIKQYDCDKSDPLPEKTAFSTRPEWSRDVVYSTTPLRIEIRFPGTKRFPPFLHGSAKTFYDDEPFEGAAAAGFRAEKVGELIFHGAFPGALAMKEVAARREAAVLSIGGNTVIKSLKKDEARGGVETERVKVYRLSYKGRPLDTSINWHFPLYSIARHHGRKERYDWNKAAFEARAAYCGSGAAVVDAERAAIVKTLRWTEAMFARAHELRFEDLNPDQRAAAEALVPAELRTGFVWPALMNESSTFRQALWKVGWEIEEAYTLAHPAEDAECRRLKDEASKHLTD